MYDLRYSPYLPTAYDRMASVEGVEALEGMTWMLARYPRLSHVAECAFWGVNYEGDEQSACHPIWTQWERENVSHYLAEAALEIEDVLEYTLGFQWQDERGTMETIDTTRWGYVRQPGVRSLSLLGTPTVTDNTADVYEFSLALATSPVLDQVLVVHPDTLSVIIPSEIEYTGGNLVVKIPRCRMVSPDNADNPSYGWTYTNLTIYSQEVDIYTISNDTSQQAVVVYQPKVCTDTPCLERWQTACMHVRVPKIGSYRLIKDDSLSYNALDQYTVDGGVISQYGIEIAEEFGTNCAGCPSFSHLYYLAGVPVNQRAEDVILRLAHAKMPSPGCGCEQYQMLWRRDHAMPDPMTRERMNNPFGMNDGAWHAFRYAEAMSLKRAGVL